MPNWLLDYRQKQARRRLLAEATDWPRKTAEAEVKLAMAVGFLRTIPSDNTSAEDGEAWRGRLARFLQQFDGRDGA